MSRVHSSGHRSSRRRSRSDATALVPASVALLLWAVVCGSFGLASLVSADNTMKVTATADCYLNFYYNGVEYGLTDPTKSTSSPCYNNANSAVCQATTTLSTDGNARRMCASCPYTRSIANVQYADVFAFRATYVPTGERDGSTSMGAQPAAAAFLAQLQWAFNGFAYNTDQTWWCFGGGASGATQPAAGWNQRGYDYANAAGWRRCTQFGSIPSDNWGYGSAITFEISATAARPNWLWTSDGNNNAPSNRVIWAAYAIPSASPTLATVNGATLSSPNAYTGYIDQTSRQIFVSVGAWVRTLQLRATMTDTSMSVRWLSQTTTYSVGSQDVSLTLSDPGVPNTVGATIQTLSNDGITTLTYTVIIIRLPNAFLQTNHWQADGTVIDNYCTGTADGVAQGPVAYTAVGDTLSGVGRAWVFNGASAYVTVPYNSLSRVTLWYWVGGDFQINLGVRFAALNPGTTCSGGVFSNPFISSSEGTSASNSRWVLGYCNNALSMVYNLGTTGVETTVSVPWTPSTGVWYNVTVTRIDHVWTFQANGATIGTPKLAAAIMPQPGAPLYFGRFQTSYLNGALDEVRFLTSTWIHFAKVDGSMYVGAGSAAMVSSGLNTPASFEYVERCDTFNFLGTGANVVMRYTMLGAAQPSNIVDYFRPRDGVTMCTMLQNGNSHLWGRAAEGPFYTPSYSLVGTDLGGSDLTATTPWPGTVTGGADVRRAISFWGRSSQGGGCCAATNTNTQTDRLPFVLSARASTCALVSPCYRNGPCLNGGVCTLSGAAPTNSYTCNCAGTGYQGSVCQTLIDNCATNPCLNGGTCTNGFYTYTCSCTGGATGTNCQFLPPSTLSALTASGVPLTFSSNVLMYSAQVSSAISAVQVNATTTDVSASASIGGLAFEVRRSSRTIALTYGGETFIPIIARGAISGTPDTAYNITIKQKLDTNSALGTLTCVGFSVISGGSTYFVNVGPLDTSISCTATASFGTSRIWFNSLPAAVGTTGAVNLAPLASGATNEFTITVQSEEDAHLGTNTHTQTYLLEVDRPFSTESRLQTLAITDNFGVAIYPVTTDPTSPITIDVDHDVRYVTIVGVLRDTTATMRLQGVLLSSGVDSVPQTLSAPASTMVVNTRTISIVAQDGSTTSTYVVNVRQTAIPTVAATAACTTVTVTTAGALLRDHTRSLYITVAPGNDFEWLHVGAISDDDVAPLSLFLRGSALPDLTARQYDVSSVTTSGKHSHVTLSNINAATYYLSYQIPATAPASVQSVSPTFDVCAYAATPLQLNVPLTGRTVKTNGYAMFSYSLTPGQVFSSSVLVLTTTTPIPSTTPYLQVYAALNLRTGAAQQDLNAVRGALATDTNPITGSSTTPHDATVGAYQASARITNPSNGLRAVFFVFADPTLVNAPALCTFDVVAVPPLPSVSSVYPTSASMMGGIPITISGSSFEPTGSQLQAGLGYVSVTGTGGFEKNCSNPTYTNSRQILCIIPGGSTGLEVDVQVNLYGRRSHTAAAARFKYDANCIVVNDTSAGAPEGATTCFQCKPGNYSTAALTTDCAACPVGSYTFGFGQSTCTECSPGTYAPKTGSSLCFNCPSGSATSGTGQASCPQCLAGRYAATDGLVNCALCDAGSYSPQSNATACVLCAPGSVQPTPGSDGCAQCEAGKSMPVSGAATCLPCTGGKFANSTGLANCYSCPAGKYSPGGTSECTDCPKGSYTATEGQAQCLLCGPGTFGSATGQTTCSPCALGTASSGQGTQDACTTCADGFVATTIGLVQCVACAPGSASFGANKGLPCARCPAGSYQPFPNQVTCLPCQPGTYFNTTGAVQCDSCPVGRVQPLPAMGLCDPCPIGYAQSLPGKTECTACTPGKIQPATGQVECTNCPAGYANDRANATECVPCGPGQSSVPGSSQCTDCAVGYYARQTASTECAPCDRGQYGNTTKATACFSCPPGYINTFAGSSSCFGCPVGEYQPSPAQTRCLDCEAGFYNALQNQTICSQCGPATFSLPGALQCTNCTIGRASTASGVRVCPACPEGSYQDQEGQQYCNACPSGSASNAPGATACTPCSPGTFAGYPGMYTCAACPAGTTMPSGAATLCNLCAVGRYQPGVGSETCLPCPEGTYSNVTGVQACEACQPGTSNPNPGQVACTPCAAGYSVAATGALTCSACPVGTFSPSAGTQQCIRCEAGTFNNETTASVCPQCRPGTFQGQDAQTYCLQCTAGKYSSFGATGCDQCGARTIAPNSGASTCYSCDSHASANDLSTVCVCDIGYAGIPTLATDGSNQTVVVCRECPRGAVCNSVGTLWDTMLTESGWWSPVSGVYYQCLVPTQCVGGAPTGSADQCRSHYTGPMCAYCDIGYSQGVDGECNACSSSVNSEYYTAIVVIIFVGAIVLLLYIIVASGDRLMDIAFAEEERLEREAQGFSTHTSKEQADLYLARNRHGNIITLRGPPAPLPDFTFKLKILLGFLQVITNLSFGLSIQWPPTFSAFLNWFNPANLDFIKYSSVDCLGTWTYYDKVILFVAAPPACFLLLLLCYFIPLNVYITCCRNYNQNPSSQRPASPTHSDGSRASTSDGMPAVPALDQKRAQARDRKRSRRNFWKMFLFALFLLYPTLSATILRMYICVDVQGTSYLVADMRTVCHDATWDRATYLGLPAIALYPIGIPLFFIGMIWRYRNRLEEAGVRAQLGFIYDAYEHRYYWFEMADMVYKLAVTSAVAFLPNDAQLQTAMGVVYLYLALVLLTRPFLRKGDDALLGFALIEIILLLLAGLTFDEVDGYSHTYDVLMSVVLIMVVGLFVGYFLLTAGTVLRKLIRNSEWGKRRGYKSSADTAKTHKLEHNRGIEGEMAAHKIDRRSMLRASSGGGAASGRLQAEQLDHANVMHTRNPLFDVQSPRASVAMTGGAVPAINTTDSAASPRQAAMQSGQFSFGRLPPNSPSATGGDGPMSPTSPRDGGMEMTSLLPAAGATAAAAPAPEVAPVHSPEPQATGYAPVPVASPEPMPPVPAEAPAEAPLPEQAPISIAEVQPVVLLPVDAVHAAPEAAPDAAPDAAFAPEPAVAAMPPPFVAPVEDVAPLPVPDAAAASAGDDAAVPAAAAVEAPAADAASPDNNDNNNS